MCAFVSIRLFLPRKSLCFNSLSECLPTIRDGTRHDCVLPVVVVAEKGTVLRGLRRNICEMLLEYLKDTNPDPRGESLPRHSNSCSANSTRSKLCSRHGNMLCSPSRANNVVERIAQHFCECNILKVPAFVSREDFCCSLRLQMIDF